MSLSRRNALLGAVSGLAASRALAQPAPPYIAPGSNSYVTTTGALTARTLANRFGTPFNIMDFGAPNNGGSNPASGRYASLGALQAAIATVTGGGGTTLQGVTVATTMELDWIAYGLALYKASVYGGVIYMPSGAGYQFTNSNSVSDGSGTLTLPATTTISYSDGVSILGDWPGSVLNWPNDLGSGVAAITCGGRGSAGGTGGSSGGFIVGITMVGPGVGGTYGSSSSNMQGLATNDRRVLEKCNINGFKQAINVVGGQTSWRDLFLQGYYGMYWDYYNTSNFGDMHIERVVVGTCLLAALAVNYQWALSNIVFTKCFLGTAPFSCYKETNGGSGAHYTSLIFSGVEQDECQYENIGQGMIADDQASTTPLVQVYNCIFRHPQFSWNSGIKVAGASAYAVMSLGSANGLLLDGIDNPEGWFPGTISMFRIGGNLGFDLRGDVGLMLTNCMNAVSPQVNVFASGDWDYYSSRLEQYGGDSTGHWIGKVVDAGSLPSVGNVMVYSGGQNVAVSTGSGTEQVAGVAMYVPGSGNFIVIAYEGPVLVTTTGTPTADLGFHTAASGNASTANTSNSYVGVAISSGSGGWNALLSLPH